MKSKKKNPNDVQIRQAKTTRPGSIEELNEREYQEILDNKEKKVKADPDEGVADEQPFDAKSNNMHQKR